MLFGSEAFFFGLRGLEGARVDVDVDIFPRDLIVDHDTDFCNPLILVTASMFVCLSGWLSILNTIILRAEENKSSLENTVIRALRDRCVKQNNASNPHPCTVTSIGECEREYVAPPRKTPV